MKYATKWPEYARQWDRMAVEPSREAGFGHLAAFAVAHKERYQAIEAKCGVPWWLIAVLHRRESDADFATYLGNGDRLDRPTRNVPRGRGPFQSFEAGALDALHLDGLDAVTDWRLEKALYHCELFNGIGYELRGLPSPYIWGGTNIQRPGKYISDGHFSSSVMDPQPGCAPLLLTIAKLDPTVQFVREAIDGAAPALVASAPMHANPPIASAPPSPPKSWLASLASIFSSRGT